MKKTIINIFFILFIIAMDVGLIWLIISTSREFHSAQEEAEYFPLAFGIVFMGFILFFFSVVACSLIKDYITDLINKLKK